MCDPMKTTHAASVIGRKGGRVGGSVKARPASHYSAISRAYWEKRRAFITTFLAMPDADKAEMFRKHGLDGANQTAANLWAYVSK